MIANERAGGQNESPCRGIEGEVGLRRVIRSTRVEGGGESTYQINMTTPAATLGVQLSLRTS